MPEIKMSKVNKGHKGHYKLYLPLVFVEEFAVGVFAFEESVTELSSKVSWKASFPGSAPWAFSFF